MVKILFDAFNSINEWTYEVMRWSMSENLENSTFQAVLAYYSDPCKSVKNEDLSKLFIGDLEHTYS